MILLFLHLSEHSFRKIELFDYIIREMNLFTLLQLLFELLDIYFQKLLKTIKVTQLQMIKKIEKIFFKKFIFYDN